MKKTNSSVDFWNFVSLNGFVSSSLVYFSFFFLSFCRSHTHTHTFTSFVSRTQTEIDVPKMYQTYRPKARFVRFFFHFQFAKWDFSWNPHKRKKNCSTYNNVEADNEHGSNNVEHISLSLIKKFIAKLRAFFCFPSPAISFRLFVPSIYMKHLWIFHVARTNRYDLNEQYNYRPYCTVMLHICHYVCFQTFKAVCHLSHTYKITHRKRSTYREMKFNFTISAANKPIGSFFCFLCYRHTYIS